MRMALVGPAVALSALIAGTANPVMTTTGSDRAETSQQQSREQTITQHPYVGMWVTADGHIRQELLANGRYDEARGSRQTAYQGRYEVRGSHIDYWDDTGFTSDGTFVNQDELHHGEMIFYREKE
jgi:Agrobacterium tumefaciens protein Atu4866